MEGMAPREPDRATAPLRRSGRQPVEVQVDNIEKVEDLDEFLYGPAFQTNPIGVDFDPDELCARHVARRVGAKASGGDFGFAASRELRA